MQEMIKTIREHNYDLETLLLCTPFESDRDRNLLGSFTEELFFENGFYSEPFIKKQIEIINEEINKIKQNITTNENNVGLEEKIKEISELKEKKSNLEKRIRYIDSFKEMIFLCNYSEDIAYVRSFPGSGKTTLLHKILYDYRKTHCSLVYDFKSFIPEMIISGMDCKNLIFDSNDVNVEDTLVKFIFILTTSLNDLIVKKKFTGPTRDDDYKFYLQKMYSNFYKLFDEHEEMSDVIMMFSPFFDIIKSYTNDENYQQLIQKTITFLSNAFKDRNNDERIEFLLRLVLVIKICNLSYEQIKNRNYKFIIAFDNLEYFIGRDVIYDEDILKIEDILQKFLREIEVFLQNGVSVLSPCQNIFLGHFKFIILIRDSTNFLAGPVHNDDKHVAVLDITDVYSLNEIHKKRYEALKKMEALSKEQNEIYTTIQDILSDISPYKNSSGISIEEMFNHNKRRMTNYLYCILSDNENRRNYWALRNELVCIEKLNIEEEITDTTVKEKRNIWKSACRNYILRLLMDNVQKTSYFSDLLAMGRNDYDELGKGYARRILTYLHLIKLEKEKEDENEYVGFYDMIRNVFEKPSFGAFHQNKGIQFEIIANILIKLNESEKNNNNWCQLILIKFKHKRIEKETLVEELRKQYEGKYNDMDFGIKITEAGSYYLTLMPKFEYFACRYYPSSKPLYLFDNINPNINGNNSVKKIEDFPCYNYIEKVKRQTIGYMEEGDEKRIGGCIQIIAETEDLFFSSRKQHVYLTMYNGKYLYKDKRSSTGISQIKNIIVNHIGYLDGFRGFISLFNENHENGDYVPKEYKKILCQYILDVINEYLEVLKFYSKKKDEKGTYYIDDDTLRESNDNKSRLVEKTNETLSSGIKRERDNINANNFAFKSLFEH